MRKIGKKLCIAMCFVLIFSITAVAMPLSERGDFKVTPYYSAEFVLIKEINGNSYTVISERDDAKSLSFELVDKSIVIDNKTGKAIKKESLKEADRIFIYYDYEEEFKDNQQITIQAIVANTDEDKTPAHLHTVENIKYNEESIKVSVDGGSLYLTVPDTATVNKLGNTDKLTVGTKFFAWYDVVALSYPAFGGTDRITILPDRAIANDFFVVADNSPLIYKSQSKNGITMLPLRAVAEKLGYNVTWNPSVKSVDLTKDNFTISVYIGGENYFLGNNPPVNLGAKAYIIDDGITYVPAQLFSQMGFDLWQYNGVIAIDKTVQ